MENFKLGDRATVLSKKAKGEIVFMGETHFGGVWYGIALDEPKGQNNGTVKGKCYFKCPKNHGIFVKACQLVKENENSNHCNDKLANIPSKIRAYPNYLKASSKNKNEKDLFPLNNDAVHQTMPEIKAECTPAPDPDTSLNKDLSLELQSIKQENEVLKNRLRDSEKRFKKSMEKYNRSKDEIEELKKNLDSKIKQINVQKCHLRMLKMRQCNHYKSVDSLIGPKSRIRSKGTVTEDSQNFSDDEFDLESMKALISMRRIVELEEQNRIMIEGLIELRDFLNSQCKSRFMDIEIQPRLKVKNSGPCSSDSNSPSSLLVNNGLSPEESESQLKEYKDMLTEMRKYSEIIKEKGNPRNDFDKHKSHMYPSGNFIQNGKDLFSSDDNIKKFKNRPLDNSGINPSRNLKNQDSLTNGEAFQKPEFDGNKHAQNLFQMFGGQNASKPFNLAPKVKDNICFDNIGDSVPSNISHEKNKSSQKCDATVMEERKQCSPHVLWNQQMSSDFTSY